MMSLTKKQRIISILVVLMIVITIVAIIAYLYPNKAYAPTSADDPKPQDAQLKKISEDFTESLLLTEEQGGGDAPHMFYKQDGTYTLFYIDQKHGLRVKDFDTNNKPTGDAQLYTPENAVIKNIALTQIGSTGYLAYTKVQDSKESFVLETFNENIQSTSLKVFAEFSIGEPFENELEQFDNATLAVHDNTIYLFTNIHGSDEQLFRIRAFDAQFKETGVQKDLDIKQAKITGGEIYSAVMTENANFVFITQQSGGADLCAADKTTETNIMALQYDKDWNLLDENTLITGAKTITHHPVQALYDNGKIFVLYYAHNAKRNMPQCINGDIPVAGDLKIGIYNTQLAPLQTLVVHDGEGGDAGLSFMDIHGNVLSAVHELKRKQTVDAVSALVLKTFDLTERVSK